MNNTIYKSAFCLVLSLFGTACKSQTDSITYGCSGGFTGGGSGVKVISDGKIFKWTSTLEKISEEELRIDAEFANQAFSRLEKLKISDLEYKELGNLTCTLTVKRKNTEHSISWTNNNDNKIESVVSYSKWLEKHILSQ